MASSLGIGSGGVATKLGIQKRSGLGLHPPCSVQMGAKAGGISAAMVTEREQQSPVLYGKRSGGGGDNALEGQERLDRWMRESVEEIVKNLREAPLLVQVFPKSGASTVTTEKSVVVEDWPAVKDRWESGETPLPEGIIFVEELDADEAQNGGAERTSRAWGVVVQGKGVGCGPVCYLLKTCRVGSGPGTGMGIFSTHFCLVKVNDLRESAQSQFKNCWLLQSQFHWN